MDASRTAIDVPMVERTFMSAQHRASKPAAAARGYSPVEFHLRMTREEIGSYLGLTLETVSRLFSRFQNDGLIVVQQKQIRIKDLPALEAVLKHEVI